jgi:hypothetical protein
MAGECGLRRWRSHPRIARPAVTTASAIRPQPASTCPSTSAAIPAHTTVLRAPLAAPPSTPLLSDRPRAQSTRRMHARWFRLGRWTVVSCPIFAAAQSASTPTRGVPLRSLRFRAPRQRRCEKGTSEGTALSPKKGLFTFSLTGCIYGHLVGKNCHSEGNASGVISESGVWELVRLKPNSPGILALLNEVHIECNFSTGISEIIRGDVLGSIAPSNVYTTHYAIGINTNSTGEQEITEFENGSGGKEKAKLEASINGSAFGAVTARFAENSVTTEKETSIIMIACKFPYCEPTITPGVSLAIPFGAGGAECTAGPILTKGTEIFLLTAGHCFAKELEKEEEEKFNKRSVESAYPNPVTKKSVGESGEFMYTKKYDIAEVKIGNVNWLLPAGGVPAVLVEWREPLPIVTSIIGVVSNKVGKVGDITCHTGIKTRLQCGRILRIGEPPSLAGYQLLTKEELVETSAKSEKGDSGGPVFEPVEGEVRMQGVEVGAGKYSDRGQGNLTNEINLITEFPEGAVVCNDIKKMGELWPAPVEAEKGIPGETTVKSCTVTGATASIEMSNPATETIKDLWITIGHPTLSWYEPMSRIEAAYPGQALLVK